MRTFNKYNFIAFLAASPIFAFCQNTTESSTYFSNALFNTLLAIILLLLIIIIAFSSVMKNVANTRFFENKMSEDSTNKKSNSIKNLSLFAFLLAGFNASAQGVSTIGGLDSFTFYFLIVVIFLEVLFLGLLIYQFKFLLQTKKAEDVVLKSVEDPILFALTDAVPVEEEESILLDHDYDGIKELDNNLPPWWKYGFYLTIVVAFIYIYRFHISDSGKSQEQEYMSEMSDAKEQVEEYMKTSANKVDETSVTYLTNEKDLLAGKEAYIGFCAACHGKLGEGGVGPNMTDAYWIHGGSIQEIFKSIKYGWPEKGMKSWKEDLSPMQIAQVTSYIISLKGTNPPNGKAAQGDLYEENKVSLNDSLNLTSDTLRIIAITDSTKTK